MSPRCYSISSSSMISPRRLAMTVSVKSTALAQNPEVTVPGLASTYLSELRGESPESTGSLLKCKVRPSTFKLPVDASVSIIMIAAGTGVAPFRGFIQQRARLASSGADIGRMTLFFGCQNTTTDFLYKGELFSLQQKAELQGKFDVVTAFSRPSDGRSGMYIQSKVREYSANLAKLLLDEDAALYICGSVTMAKAVGEEIRMGLTQYKGQDLHEVKKYEDEKVFLKWRAERKKARRWCEDVWG